MINEFTIFALEWLAQSDSLNLFRCVLADFKHKSDFAVVFNFLLNLVLYAFLKTFCHHELGANEVSCGWLSRSIEVQIVRFFRVYFRVNKLIFFIMLFVFSILIFIALNINEGPVIFSIFKFWNIIFNWL
jgi:hypothetical protein